MDTALDVIGSKELASVVEVSGTMGFVFRGDPDEFDLSNSIRYGIGAQFPTRSPLKMAAEWFGESYFDDVVTRLGSPAPASVIGDDGSIPPVASRLPRVSTINVGGTWQARNGFFAGAGINWSTKAEDREEAGVGDEFGTKFGWQFRVGYHPGVAGLPVPLPPPPPPAAPAPQHTLNVDAQCNPCTVEVGATSNVTATAQDS
jgi:hypothetical protein